MIGNNVIFRPFRALKNSVFVHWALPNAIVYSPFRALGSHKLSTKFALIIYKN